jgi:predicted transcriptional regulator
MTEMTERILTLTTQIVVAYLGANAVAISAVPGLIGDVHQSLGSLEQDRSAAWPREPRFVEGRPADRPAVDVQKSVFPDHLVCLEDGDKMTMLKRRLMTAHKLTPRQYRVKWHLPGNSMVAPNYAEVRSRLAKDAGVGRGKKAPPA